MRDLAKFRFLKNGLVWVEFDFFLLVSLGRCSFFMKSFKGDHLSVPSSRKFNRCWVWRVPGKAMQWAEIGKPEGFKNKHGLEI